MIIEISIVTTQKNEETPLQSLILSYSHLIMKIGSRISKRKLGANLLSKIYEESMSLMEMMRRRLW